MGPLAWRSFPFSIVIAAKHERDQVYGPAGCVFTQQLSLVLILPTRGWPGRVVLTRWLHAEMARALLEPAHGHISKY